MIEKIYFKREMDFKGELASGVLFYNPYPDNNNSIKLQSLNKDGVAGESIFELPFEDLPAIVKMFRKFIKGEDDAEDVDNAVLEFE